MGKKINLVCINRAQPVSQNSRLPISHFLSLMLTIKIATSISHFKEDEGRYQETEPFD